MISPETTPLSSGPGLRVQPARRSALSRLFAAAVVNPQFRETLLQAPKIALERGYLGQTFPLSQHETTLLLSIRADSLTELARQVTLGLHCGD
jgi:hypothetical protein